ncbi:MAG: hypothetical protein JWN52_2174 [Actinomycetia bacterium]|nr:hypothetical protein [Actinomycetes bacterium]
MVPSLRASSWWAHLACNATGRPEEAQEHLLRYRELGSEPEEIRFPRELLDGVHQEDIEEFEVDAGLRSFMLGISVEHTDPSEALLHFDAREHLTASDCWDLRPQLEVRSGSCLARLSRPDKADAAYHRALGLLESGAHTELRLGCHLALARIAMSWGRYEEAHPYLTSGVSAIERYRSSVSGAEGRIVLRCPGPSGQRPN